MTTFLHNLSCLCFRFEDGTLPFLGIVALQHGFNVIHRLTGSMAAISYHTLCLAKYVYDEMMSLHHGNGQSVCQVYCDTDYTDNSTQGAVISFNVLQPDGTYVGYSHVCFAFHASCETSHPCCVVCQVEKLAGVFDIHLRTGCFCNTGACQRYLGLSAEQLKHNLEVRYSAGQGVFETE